MFGSMEFFSYLCIVNQTKRFFFIGTIGNIATKQF